MKGRIEGMGRNADISTGTCRITMTGENDRENEFLRALFGTWFNGYTDEDDAILVDRLAAPFERAGWKPQDKDPNQ